MPPGEPPPTLPRIHDARAAWSPAETPLPPIDQLVHPRASDGPPPHLPLPRIWPEHAKRTLPLPPPLISPAPSAARAPSAPAPGSGASSTASPITTRPAVTADPRFSSPSSSSASAYPGPCPGHGPAAPLAATTTTTNSTARSFSVSNTASGWSPYRPLARIPHRWSEDLPQSHRQEVRDGLVRTVAEQPPLWRGPSVSPTAPSPLIRPEPSRGTSSYSTAPNAPASSPAPPGSVPGPFQGPIHPYHLIRRSDASSSVPFHPSPHDPSSLAPPLAGSHPSVLHHAPFPPSNQGWDTPYVPQRGKRKRSQKACTACHKAKRRCDRKLPCSNCLYNGKVCQYFDESGTLTAPAPVSWVPPHWSRDEEEPRKFVGPDLVGRSASMGDVQLPSCFRPARPAPAPALTETTNPEHDASALSILAEAAAPFRLLPPSAAPHEDHWPAYHTMSDPGTPPSGLSPPLGQSQPYTRPHDLTPLSLPGPSHADPHIPRTLPAHTSPGPSSMPPASMPNQWVSTLPASPRASQAVSVSFGWELGPPPPVPVGPSPLRRGRWASSPELGPTPLPTSVPVPSTPAVVPLGGLMSSVEASALAALPSVEVQESYVKRFRQVGFPLSVCLPEWSTSSELKGYAYTADPALLHALYAVVAPSEQKRVHTQAARALLLAVHGPDKDSEQDKVGVGGSVATTYALLALSALDVGQAQQATLDASTAWRTLEGIGILDQSDVQLVRLALAVAVVEGLASLYAGLRSSALCLPCSWQTWQNSDKICAALAFLAEATHLSSVSEVEMWHASLPPSLQYTGDRISSLAESGARMSLPAPPTSLAWVCMHTLAARVQLCSSHLSASAIGRGRVATLKAVVDVNIDWAWAVRLFFSLLSTPPAQPTQPTQLRPKAEEAKTLMPHAGLDRDQWNQRGHRNQPQAFTNEVTPTTPSMSSTATTTTAITTTTTATPNRPTIPIPNSDSEHITRPDRLPSAQRCNHDGPDHRNADQANNLPAPDAHAAHDHAHAHNHSTDAPARPHTSVSNLLAALPRSHSIRSSSSEGIKHLLTSGTHTPLPPHSRAYAASRP